MEAFPKAKFVLTISDPERCRAEVGPFSSYCHVGLRVQGFGVEGLKVRVFVQDVVCNILEGPGAHCRLVRELCQAGRRHVYDGLAASSHFEACACAFYMQCVPRSKKPSHQAWSKAAYQLYFGTQATQRS